MSTPSSLKKRFQLLDASDNVKFETDSLYQAVMFLTYPNDVVRAKEMLGHLRPKDMDLEELHKLAFFDLINVKTVMEKYVDGRSGDALYLVIAKTQEVSDSNRAAGIHFHFLDILGYSNNIKEARDLFKQGKVGDGILMRDNSAPGAWRKLTGQQIIDLHAYEEKRPLSFDKNKNPVPSILGNLSLSSTAKVNQQ